MPSSADRQRRQHQRHPVVDAEQLQAEQRGERAERVEGAVGEVDHAHQPEDHRQPEAQQRVERAVHQPERQLAEDHGDRDAEDVGHGALASGGRRGRRAAPPSRWRRGTATRARAGTVPVIGPKASSPVIFFTTL